MSAAKAPQRHLVDVWNPSYAENAMEQHLTVLLEAAGRYDTDEIGEEELYVWWGKVRSPNRRQPLRHQEAILEIGAELRDEPGREVHLYLTDYRSLYVAHVGAITLEDVRSTSVVNLPSYYTAKQLDCDFWYQLRDIRRLVANDIQDVIAALRQLHNLDYHDRPVSLYGGMVDLPLIVVRPDGQRFFEPASTEAATGGRLWAEADRESGGVGGMERELRENLFGEDVWVELEPTARVFIATAEKILRDHRSDPAFDFGPVLGSLSKALEVSCNAILRRAAAKLPREVRKVKLEKGEVDLTEGRHLSLGQLSRAIRSHRPLRGALIRILENGEWFTGDLLTFADKFAKVRNLGVHQSRVDKQATLLIRDELVGVGCQGVLTRLARVRVK